MGDARERLGELARQGDARDRLNQLQKGKTGVKATRIGPQGVAARLGAGGAKKAAQIKKQLQVQTGNNFVKKQNVSGQGKNLTRTVAGVAGRNKNIGAAGLKTAKNFKPAANRPVQKVQRFNNQRNAPVVIIRNDRANMNQQQRRRPMKQMQMRPQQVRVQQVPYQQRHYQPQGMRSDMVWETRYPQEMYHEPIYQQARPIIYEDIRPTRLQITTPNTYREPVYVDEYDAPIRQSPVYVQAPRSRPAPVQRIKKQQGMSSNLAARLDQKQTRPQQQQQQQQGHKVNKVLVTNLHPCVSGEDMEELFSTIGTIVSARMIREGVAEAVFSKEADALRSVEVFHNRQLDGLPMNVTIVGKKNVQRGPQPKSVLKAARGRTGYYV